MSPGSTAWGAYQQITDALRRRIDDGEWQPGSLLPSESALCTEFGVVRNTVRRALAALEADGLIETLPGRGRIVRSPNDGPPDPDAGLPQYRRIATELRAAIEAGDLAPGDALPSEAVLMDRYSVSRGTARQALADLEGAGLVQAVHGKGRYVRRP